MQWRCHACDKFMIKCRTLITGSKTSIHLWEWKGNAHWPMLCTNSLSPSPPSKKEQIIYAVISWKYPSPLFAHYFEAKVGRGLCLNTQIGLNHMPPTMLHARLSITKTAAALKEQQLHWLCTTGISGTCVDTKIRSIKATCIISGDRGWPYSSLYCKKRKPRWWPVNKASNLFVHTYKNTWWQS